MQSVQPIPLCSRTSVGASSKHGGCEMVGGKKKSAGEKRVIINPPRYSQGLRTGIHNHHQLYHILYRFVNPHSVLWRMAQRGKKIVWGMGEMERSTRDV